MWQKNIKFDKAYSAQCWEFSNKSLLGEFENVFGKSVTTPFWSLPLELQQALTVYCGFSEVDSAKKAFQRVSEVIVNSVKYCVRDAFVMDVLHSEKIPLFWQIKYILILTQCGSFVEKFSFLCYMTTIFIHTVLELIVNGCC